MRRYFFTPNGWNTTIIFHWLFSFVAMTTRRVSGSTSKLSLTSAAIQLVVKFKIICSRSRVWSTQCPESVTFTSFISCWPVCQKTRRRSIICVSHSSTTISTRVAHSLSTPSMMRYVFALWPVLDSPYFPHTHAHVFFRLPTLRIWNQSNITWLALVLFAWATINSLNESGVLTVNIANNAGGVFYPLCLRPSYVTCLFFLSTFPPTARASDHFYVTLISSVFPVQRRLCFQAAWMR